MYERLESELELVCYCNAILFKLGLNRMMYSWVVHFLNYFISISETDVEPEKAEGRGE